MENRWETLNLSVSSGSGSMVTSGPKEVSRFGINSKQVVLSPGGSFKVATEHRISAQDRNLALSIRRLKRIMAPQLSRDLVHGRRISRQTVHSRFAETSLYARRLAWCDPLTASSRKDWLLWI
ncbi:hypothetical protein TNCV_4096201 [Trichonephila clavipes]|nr:hypothetical protein TNCV_4096201 [Trichonephila clavipes]